MAESRSRGQVLTSLGIVRLSSCRSLRLQISDLQFEIRKGSPPEIDEESRLRGEQLSQFGFTGIETYILALPLAQIATDLRHDLNGTVHLRAFPR